MDLTNESATVPIQDKSGRKGRSPHRPSSGACCPLYSRHSMVIQPAVYAAGEIIQLGIGDALCVRVVKEDRRTGIHLRIMLQFINNCFHSAVSLFRML